MAVVNVVFKLFVCCCCFVIVCFLLFWGFCGGGGEGGVVCVSVVFLFVQFCVFYGFCMGFLMVYIKCIILFTIAVCVCVCVCVIYKFISLVVKNQLTTKQISEYLSLNRSQVNLEIIIIEVRK